MCSSDLKKTEAALLPTSNRWRSGAGTNGNPLNKRESGISFFCRESNPADSAYYSFDLSEYELVGSLATGGRLHAVSSEVAKDYRALFDELAASGVEIWVSTPSFADFCLVDKDFSRELLPELGMFLFCGEELHRTTAHELRRRFPQTRIVNTYGPTESTVAVTVADRKSVV